MNTKRIRKTAVLILLTAILFTVAGCNSMLGEEGTEAVIRARHYIVTDYWHDYYATDHCTLCGNTGFIDTRDATTPAGKKVGRINYCICPNGQQYREGQIPIPSGSE